MLYQRDASTAEIDGGMSINELEGELNALLRQLLDLRYAQPDHITLAIYSENTPALFELARAYYLAAKASGMSVTVSHYTANIPPEIIEEEERAAAQRARKKKKSEEEEEEEKVVSALLAIFSGKATDVEEKSKIIEMFDRKVTRLEVSKPSEFLSASSAATTAIILAIRGKSAFSIYDAEHGLHVFIQGKATNRLLVHTSDIDPKEYRAPTTLTRRDSISPVNYGECRRTYHRSDDYIEDHELPQRRDWRNDLIEALRSFTEQSHQRAAEKLIDE
jgi:hypothetical protein